MTDLVDSRGLVVVCPTADVATPVVLGIPEKAMYREMLKHVLKDALGQADACKPRRRKRLRHDALGYIFDGTTEEMGFNWLCETLNYCPQRIKDYVIEALEAQEEAHGRVA